MLCKFTKKLDLGMLSGDIIFSRRGCIVTTNLTENFVNKFSLISMALSMLFCGYLNASEQPATDSEPNSEAVNTSEQATDSVADVSEKTTSEDTKKKSKVSKKKKKCSKKTSSIKRTNEFTDQLNCGKETADKSNEVKKLEVENKADDVKSEQKPASSEESKSAD